MPCDGARRARGALAWRARRILGAAAGPGNAPRARPRAGTPPTVRKWRGRGAEAPARVLAVDAAPAARARARACRPPAQCGRPVTARASAPPSRPARARVWWGAADRQPHRSRSWRNATARDAAADAFAARVAARGTGDADAPRRRRAAATASAAPSGPASRRWRAPPRTAAACAAHRAPVSAPDPAAPWRVLAAHRNPHQAAALVRRGAARCGLADALGVPGRAGAPPSQATRAACRADPAHRLQFRSPLHPSWRNQRARWFGLRARRVRNRGDFAALEALRARLLACLADCTQTARPVNGTYTGRPLRC